MKHRQSVTRAFSAPTARFILIACALTLALSAAQASRFSHLEELWDYIRSEVSNRSMNKALELLSQPPEPGMSSSERLAAQLSSFADGRDLRPLTKVTNYSEPADELAVGRWIGPYQVFDTANLYRYKSLSAPVYEDTEASQNSRIASLRIDGPALTRALFRQEVQTRALSRGCELSSAAQSFTPEAVLAHPQVLQADPLAAAQARYLLLRLLAPSGNSTDAIKALLLATTSRTLAQVAKAVDRSTDETLELICKGLRTSQNVILDVNAPWWFTHKPIKTMVTE
jgi:hypothetical protein